MKKVTLIFGFTLCLILSAVVVLNAGWWVYTVTEPASSSCSTPSYGDELNEGFLGAGYENTWTETGSPDEDATLPGSPPTDCCDEGLYVSGSDTTAIYSEYAFGSALTYPVDIVYYVYFSTITIPTTYEIIRWSQWDDDTSVGTAGPADILIKNNSGTLQIAAKGATTSAYTTVVTGTWYKIKLHLDVTDTSSYIQIDDGTQNTFQRNAASGQYLRIGYCTDLETGEALEVYIGYVYVNTP